MLCTPFAQLGVAVPDSLVYSPYIVAKDLIDCTKVGFEMDISTTLVLVVTTLKYECVYVVPVPQV